jgi:hypothetical protein
MEEARRVGAPFAGEVCSELLSSPSGLDPFAAIGTVVPDSVRYGFRLASPEGGTRRRAGTNTGDV